MPVTSPEASVKNYLDAMANPQSKQKYKDSIDRVTENPMAKAADADELYLRRVQESVATGKRRRKLLETPMQLWKDNAKSVGADRLSSGAQKAAAKMRNHFSKWNPVYQQASDAVKTMPKGTREDAKARVNKVIDIMMDAAGR